MKTRITIRGQTYTVRSDEDDVDLQEVAAFVNARMDEVAKGSRKMEPYTVAMLAALNIAQEHARYRRQVATSLDALERDLEGAEVLLQHALGGRQDAD